MEGPISALIRRIAGKRKPAMRPQPLLLELFQEVEGDEVEAYSVPPFAYTIKRKDGRVNYQVTPDVSSSELVKLRQTVAEMSATLRPSSIEPLTFTGLIEVLCQAGIGHLASIRDTDRVRALSRLAAFEAAGIPTIYSLSL